MSVENTEDRIFELIDRWAILRKHGQDMPVAELCRDFPALIPEVERRIDALQSTAWLDQRLDTGDGPEKISPAQFGLPERLGRYELRHLLGSGGFGQVWRGYDPELQRHVAIKIPRPDRISTPERLEQFMQEARRVAQLKHPGIVAIYDVGNDADRCYIVSDLIEGHNLAEIIAENRPTPQAAVRLLAEIAESLDYAHKQGFIHRDVKPSNILVDRQERTYLTDFGIAATISELTTSGQRYIGTQAYMSPEQAHGEALDHRTDVYSLGVVLFELLTGELPFPGNAGRRSSDSAVPSARQRNRKISSAIAVICMKAMAAKPRDRYSSALAMAHDLRKFTRPRRWTLWAILGGVAAFALVVYGIGQWFLQREIKETQQQAATIVKRGQDVADKAMARLHKTLPPPVIEQPKKSAPEKIPFDLSFAKTSFDLSGQELSDDDYARLGNHVILSSLNLAETKTSDTQLGELKSALGLRTLNLKGTSITDAGLRHLEDLPILQELSLDRTKISDAGLVLVGKMHLQQLSLSRTGVTDQGLKTFDNPYGVGGHLRELDLSQTSITDASLPILQKIRRLKTLKIQGTNVTEQGIAKFKTVLPDCEVQR